MELANRMKQAEEEKIRLDNEYAWSEASSLNLVDLIV